MAQMRQIEFTLIFDPDIQSNFHTDPIRLKQILMNLIGNAIKFTFEGFIKVICKNNEINEDKLVEIIVEDSGIGISKENLPKLFKMFSMVDMSKEINKTGTGLGLYISKKLSLKLGPPNYNGI